jgi:hypothetical protein
VRTGIDWRVSHFRPVFKNARPQVKRSLRHGDNAGYMRPTRHQSFADRMSEQSLRWLYVRFSPHFLHSSLFQKRHCDTELMTVRLLGKGVEQGWLGIWTDRPDSSPLHSHSNPFEVLIPLFDGKLIDFGLLVRFLPQGGGQLSTSFS